MQSSELIFGAALPSHFELKADKVFHGVLYFALPLTAQAGPIDAALRATEAPPTLRAAFTVEMTSAKAARIYTFDPRKGQGERWALVNWTGEDSALDEAGAAWGAETAPDGRLFPDDLRASFGDEIGVEDLGLAWRVSFDHAPSANDSALDVWATQRLKASAWLEPETGRFLRIDYTLPRPVRGPDGGRLMRLEQSYLLEIEPVWKMSYVSQFRLDFEARAAFRTIRQSYKAEIKDATFFFSSRNAQIAFDQDRQMSELRVALLGEETPTLRPGN